MSAFAERACQGMMIVLNDDLTRNTLNWYVRICCRVVGFGLRVRTERSSFLVLGENSSFSQLYYYYLSERDGSGDRCSLYLTYVSSIRASDALWGCSCRTSEFSDGLHSPAVALEMGFPVLFTTHINSACSI